MGSNLFLLVKTVVDSTTKLVLEKNSSFKQQHSNSKTHFHVTTKRWEETDPQVKLSKWNQMILDFVEDIFMCGFII